MTKLVFLPIDKINEVDETENSEPSVIKMLSKEEELRSMPWETRTPDTLIKSQVLYQLS